MKYLKNTTEFYIEEPTVLSLGKFDGIHRGHELLMEHLASKKEAGLAAVIFTFNIPPRKSVEQVEAKVLTTNEEKMHIFEQIGIDAAIRAGVKGILLLCAQGDNYNSKVLELALNGYPLVLVDRRMQGISIPCVRTDNYEAANEVTKILIAMGHKKICFLTHASVTTTTIHERYEGFAHCMLKYEDANGTFAKLEKYNHIPEDIEKECREFDYAQIAEILEKNRECTAYIAAEYRIGVLFSKYLKEHGISKKIAVFDGIDEIYEQDDFIHVRQNEFAMGQQAVTLLEEITTGKKQNEDIIIPYQISGIL